MKSNTFDLEPETVLNSERPETEPNFEIDEPVVSEEEELEFVPNQVIVKFKDDVATTDINTLQSTLDAEVLGTIPNLGMQLWQMPETEVADVMATYGTNSNIEYIVPNYKRELAQTFPDDTSFDQLWGLHNTGQTGGTPGADIDAPEAWDITTGSGNNVVVGVIDTGIDYTHPDLAANIWTNPGEIPDNGEDDDGNGYVDDVHGYDFSDFDSDPMDVDGHGTHVAGTIGAVGDNNEGVVGVNWSPQLMAIKIFPNAFDFNIIAAIEYSANMGVPITNNSWGGGPPSQALEDAIAYAGEAGQLFVAAAGNFGSDNDAFPDYPSGYDLENILSVAATDHNDELANFSNFGATTVDIGAPGVDIYSTVPYGDGYDFFSGTSMASPHVAGAASLLLSENPDLDAVQLKNQLMVSADPIPSLNGLTVTGGRLNAYQALVSPVAGQIQGSKWHDLNQNGDWDADEPGLSGWTIYLDDNNNGELDEGENSTVTNSAGDYIFNFLTPGTYTVAEVLKPGWEQTHPTDPETYSVDVAEEETVTDINFGNVLTEPASISGSKWHDLNQDGVWDEEEPALEGWTIYLDDNENGQLDEEELSTVTDDDGEYEFSDLSPDIYTVAEVLQQGWEQTSPVDGTYILDLAPNEAAEEIDFGNFELPPGEIQGSKWNDLNGNGERDPEEPGLEGWTIYLDDNNNGELDEGERSTVTDENGEYAFSDLPTGGYIVAEVLQETWQQTYPSSGRVFTDPLGDFFGFADPELDIESVSAALRGETLSLTMNFFTPIAAPSENLPESVAGFWDLDLDQDASTGVPANQTFFAPPDQQGGPLGVEVFVDLFSESFQPGFVDLIDAVNFNYIATVPIAYESDSFEIQIPLSFLGDDGLVNYGTIAGTFFEPTDAAPNTEFGTLGDAASTDSQPNTEILSDRTWNGVSITNSETENRSTVVEFNADLATSAFPHFVELEPGQLITDLDFGNWQPIILSGQKWYDVDGDGELDEGEEGLEGWTIYLDDNNNGELDEDETFTVTDEEGNYSFTLPEGNYTIAEVPQEGWQQTAPADGTYEVSLAAGESADTLNFGNQALPGEISGSKWHDLNGNGDRDSDEPGLEGWTIYLDANENGELDEDERSTVTDENGEYVFDNVPTGRYIVAEVLQENWEQTSPTLGNLVNEPNDTIPDAVISGLAGSGTFTQDGVIGDNPDFPDADVDMIELTLEAGEQVTIDIDASEVGSFLDPVLRLFNSNGVEVAVNDDFNGLDSFIDFTASTSDTYYVGVSGYSNFSYDPFVEGSGGAFFSTGEYSLEIIVGEGGLIPSLPGSHRIEIEPGESVSDLDFGNWKPGTFSGTKWYDVDGNGEFNNDEVGLEGWTIFIDDNGNGELDESETSTVTDAEGNYSFELSEGTYTVAEVLQPGWVQTTPEDGSYTVSLAAGDDLSGFDFGNQAIPGEISGSKWNDLDENGEWDEGEPGLEGWTIYLDTNENGELDEDEVSTVTDEDGNYSFTDLEFGTYIVAEELQPNWVQTFPSGFPNEVTQITDNDFSDYNPNIDGDKVVWSAWDGNDEEIYLYDGEAVIQLTDNNVYDYSPQISDGNVVWTGEDQNFITEVYFYDGESVTQLTDNSFYEYGLQISGNNVVWSAWDGNDEEIFLYDGSQVIQLTDNDLSDYNPDIDGDNIVWSAWDGNDEEIFFYEGDTITQLTDNDFSDYSPQVSGNNVVWSAWDGFDEEIFFYDGDTITQLTDNDFSDYSPQISGNNVVWSGQDENFNTEIFFYDGDSTTQVTDNNFFESNPQIDGNNVVWSAYDGFDEEIYLYDGNTITQVTDNDVFDYDPEISGNNITWSGDDEFDFDSEIYVIGEGNTHRLDLEPGTTVTDLNFGNHSLVTTINGTSENDELVGTPDPDEINGRQGNDKLFGEESDDTLRGGRDNDALFGGEGDDILFGNRDDDQLYGEEGNDTLRGNSEDDILYGGEGDDFLVGGPGDDTLIGVDPNTPQAGSGEIDRLRGVGGNDLFVLGDEFTSYYNDTDDSNPGLEDYAQIRDFTLGEDIIQLQGSSDDYVLDASPFGQVNDTAIFLTTSDQNELIGIVRNVPLVDLDLTDNTAFNFV